MRNGGVFLRLVGGWLGLGLVTSTSEPSRTFDLTYSTETTAVVTVFCTSRIIYDASVWGYDIILESPADR